MIIWNRNITKKQNCYLDTDSFIVYIKTKDIYAGIAKDVKTRFDTSNYGLDRPLEKIKKWKWNWFSER